MAPSATAINEFKQGTISFGHPFGAAILQSALSGCGVMACWRPVAGRHKSPRRDGLTVPIRGTHRDSARSPTRVFAGRRRSYRVWPSFRMDLIPEPTRCQRTDDASWRIQDLFRGTFPRTTFCASPQKRICSANSAALRRNQEIQAPSNSDLSRVAHRVNVTNVLLGSEAIR